MLISFEVASLSTHEGTDGDAFWELTA